MPIRSLFIASLSAAALFGAGCISITPSAPSAPPAAAPTEAPSPAGGSVPTASPTPTSPAKTTSPKTTTAPQPTVSVVTIQNFAFSPKDIAIKAGDTVKWVNRDGVSHTTASDGALIWDSGNLASGQSFSRVFASPGSYKYHCGLHPGMTGTVYVR